MLGKLISSSSTRTMDGLRFSAPLLNSFFLGLQWNPQVEGGPMSPGALEADGAAVVFRHNAPHDQQAETGAGANRLGGKSLLQHFRLVLVANSVPGIGDPDMHRIALQP